MKEKNYPETITLRKRLVIGAVAFAAFIVLLIFHNIYSSSHPKTEAIKDNKGAVKVVPAENSEPWYKNQEIHKASVVIPVVNKTVPPKAGTITKTAIETAAKPVTIDEELKKAMNAPITSNQLTGDIGSSNDTHSPTAQPSSSSAAVDKRNDNDQNLQGEKKDFLQSNTQAEEIYLREKLNNPLSPYELKAGAIIPAILITGLNSDLPGQITAQVRSNVYDTIAGKYMLIPQGAKLTGLYDSQVVYGQRRVLVVWKRVIFPNGQSISLEGMPGVDMSGYAGFNDQVNNHYFKIFGSVILMSVISAGAQLSQPQQQQNPNAAPTVNQTLAASLGTNIMNTANTITQKNLGIQPTLVIRPGYLFNVSVTKDLIFPGEYVETTQY